jgi:RHS repeat-associated protein
VLVQAHRTRSRLSGGEGIFWGRVLRLGTPLDVTYNSKGKATRSTDPLGRTTLYNYAPNEIDLLEVRQVNGTSTELLASYTYNDKHQILTSTDAAGQTTTSTYTATNQLHTVIAPPHGGFSEAERTTTYTYNDDGQLTSVSGPVAGTTRTYEYDGYGRPWRVTDPEGYAAVREYDALDRLVRITYPDGTYEETAYDKLDASKRRDRLGRWTQTFYDALRRPVATRDTAGRTVQKNEWVSCASGCGGGGAKLSKLIDANGNATTWEYDIEGRVTRQVRSNGATHNYTYENTTSRLQRIADPNGSAKTYTYGRDDNLVGRSYTVGLGVLATPAVTFSYDPVYDRMLSIADGTGTTSYAYYPPGVLGAGRLHSVDGPLDDDTITYSYDELGRVTSKQIGGPSRVETQAFDVLGRLTQITNSLGSFSYTYDGAVGRPASVTYPNGQQTTYAYLDNLGDRRLQEIHNKKPGGSTLSKFNYTYNTVGDVLTWRQQSESNPAQVYELGYDDSDQLTAAILQSTDPTPVTLKRYYYAYDPAGNRTAEQIDDAVRSWTYNNTNQIVTEQAGGALVFKGTVNEPATVTVGGKPAAVAADNRFVGSAVVSSGTGQVAVAARDMAGNLRTNTYQVTQGGTSKSFTFDANGNMTSDGTREYHWDAEDQLVRVTQGGNEVVSFGYDGKKRRARKTAAGVTVGFLNDGDDVVEERPGTGGTIEHFQGPGIDNVLGTIDPANVTSYYVRDHLGSIRQRTSASGQPILTRDYDASGNLLAGTSAAGWAFTGREWEPETQTYYYRARYYSPQLGRFASEDPLGFRGGANLYSYVGANPVSRVDPTGLAPSCDIPPSGMRCDQNPPKRPPNCNCMEVYRLRERAKKQEIRACITRTYPPAQKVRPENLLGGVARCSDGSIVAWYKPGDSAEQNYCVCDHETLHRELWNAGYKDFFTQECITWQATIRCYDGMCTPR